MKILIVEYLISWQHAMRIIRGLNVKRHIGMGYYFDLRETNYAMHVTQLTPAQKKRLYAEYPRDAPLHHLKVYRDKEDKQTVEVTTHDDLPPMNAEVMFIVGRLLLGTSLKDLGHVKHPADVRLRGKHED